MANIALLSPSRSPNDHQHPPSDHHVSSPSHPSTTGSKKIRKPPPITPKRFSRFFTPRSSVHSRDKKRSSGRSGRELQDITRNAVNRNGQLPGIGSRRKVNFSDISIAVDENLVTPRIDSGRKRKHIPSPESSPLLSSPCKRARHFTPPLRAVEPSQSPLIGLPPSSPPALDDTLELIETRSNSDDDEEVVPVRIHKAKSTGAYARLLQRSFGGITSVGRGFRYDHCSDWRQSVVDFNTSPDDQHTFSADSMPFSTTSCNTNTLVAIADENGDVRLLESANDNNPPFSQCHIKMHIHNNAIMDIVFSSDDSLVATASGDQTVRITDVRTQTTKCVFAGHGASVKNVRFQPGDDNVLSTSSRDGTVQIWDLRVSGLSGAVYNNPARFMDDDKVIPPTMTIRDVHGDRQLSNFSTIPTPTAPRSVTALSFLPAPRSHLILTGCEASTTLRLWDIRTRCTRRGTAQPLSTTTEPDSHKTHRNFGIGSISVSTDGTRIYALSRDNTVYAYSTSHLILGHAPELSGSALRHSYGTGKRGLGPLYGFRHPNLRVPSFYVKTAVRPSFDDMTELLAVGSGDGCAVVFPTDEASLRDAAARSLAGSWTSSFSSPTSFSSTEKTSIRRTASSSLSSRLNDTIPIYTTGAALVRGHDKEVHGVCWTKNGGLITLSDDFTARCWREDRKRAIELRTKGEGEGKRWGCGWSEVAGWEDDD